MLGAEAAALILDDTAGVWPRHGGNLLQPRRYIYFPADHARWAGSAAVWCLQGLEFKFLSTHAHHVCSALRLQLVAVRTSVG